MRATLFLLCFSMLASCAYPRRSTNIHAAPPSDKEPADRPKNLWTMKVIDAVLPARKPSGLPWDSDGTGPDPFVRLRIDDRLVWESETKQDQIKPQWEAVLPRNVSVPEGSKFRLEVWDRDNVVDADPMGAIQRTGLPTNALPDAMARLTLDNAAMLTIQVTAPRAHKGVGIRFEVRPDALKVLEVEPFSPAARAGIEKGQQIVAIGTERIAHMDDQEATSQLSLAAARGKELVVRDRGGQERPIKLDDGHIWLAM